MSIQLDDDDETEFYSIEYLPPWMLKDIVVVCSHNKDHLHTHTHRWLPVPMKIQ